MINKIKKDLQSALSLSPKKQAHIRAINIKNAPKLIPTNKENIIQ